MKVTRIYKAQDTGGPVEEATILIQGEIPRLRDYDLMRQNFESEAKMLEQALYNSLPGGTYDRLLAAMMMRKASLFVVPHAT